ncbi:Protein N-terminal amidase [Colletotrichum sidae]|uniref:Protein N-terminal amidase n=1 Tax=Colletotrichum sidae TaxID=1347389 RepID=A0A4R8TIE4_9PEZI|nr:Protein N-terminal amidase [Colletotrichum sidae]
MRIGCLQFAPQVGDIDNNLNRADSVLSKADTDDLDLLVLPELAFSGYNFKSLQHISPYLEPSGSGITSLWARTTALKYNCNVVVGYPEKVDVSNQWPTGPEYYNSAIVVNGDGETIANYRKSFLYYTDETWALEGNAGFFEGWIPGLGNASIGICMDLNPYKFQAPWHAFEFAFHILENESNLVIVSMAWMTREDGRMFSRMPNEPDMDTLTYWVTRLEPLIRSENEDEIIVVFCNRTGTEDDVVYAGTSAVVGVQDGEVKIYGLLGRGEKELLVVDTSNPPYAKLVYRPESERPSAVHSELQRLFFPHADATNVSAHQTVVSFCKPSETSYQICQGATQHSDTPARYLYYEYISGGRGELSWRRQHQSSHANGSKSDTHGYATEVDHSAISSTRTMAIGQSHPAEWSVRPVDAFRSVSAIDSVRAIRELRSFHQYRHVESSSARR